MARLLNSTISMRGRTSPWHSYLETGIDAVTREGQDGKPVDSIFLTEVVGNGQRRTRATIRVDSKDFKELVKVMFAADRKAAIKAFAQVLNATA